MTDQPTPETGAMFTDNVPDDVQIVTFCERLERERNAAITAHNDALLRLHITTAERDELNRQLSVALKGKRPYSSKFADETIAAQVERIADLEEKLNGWFAERDGLLSELADERAKKSDALIAAVDHIARLRAALELIAVPMRPDGSYNRDREACGILARAALNTPAQ